METSPESAASPSVMGSTRGEGQEREVGRGSGAGGGGEGDGDGEGGAVEGGVVADVGAGLEPDVGEAAGELGEGDAQVHPGEVGAHAAVRARAEGDVAVDGTGEVEDVGLGELGLVAVGRGPVDEDPLPRADVMAVDL